MKNKHKIAVFLAARSGSKRLPNKHFLKLNSNLTSKLLIWKSKVSLDDGIREIIKSMKKKNNKKYKRPTFFKI